MSLKIGIILLSFVWFYAEMWDGNVLVRLCEIHLCLSYACQWGRLIYSSGEISSASLKQKEAGHSCVIALATIAMLIFGNIDAVKVRLADNIAGTEPSLLQPKS